jgi:hypothetical protein
MSMSLREAAAAAASASAELDPLAPVLPADGTIVARLAEIAVRARSGRVDVAGVRGSADAALVA